MQLQSSKAERPSGRSARRRFLSSRLVANCFSGSQLRKSYKSSTQSNPGLTSMEREVHLHNVHQQQPAVQPRAYANLPALERSAHLASNCSRMGYVNLAGLGQPAELSDPQLNYMDMDFTSGVGVPAETHRLPELNYAQLSLPADEPHQKDLSSSPSSSASTASAKSPQQEVAYCELDHRAMAALEATLQEESLLHATKGDSLPRLRRRHRTDGQGGDATTATAARRPVEKHWSLRSIRSSLSRSLSRLSLRRQQAAAGKSQQLPPHNDGN